MVAFLHLLKRQRWLVYVLVVETLSTKNWGGGTSSLLWQCSDYNWCIGPIIAFSILFGETLAILRIPGSVVSFVSMSVGQVSQYS